MAVPWPGETWQQQNPKRVAENGADVSRCKVCPVQKTTNNLFRSQRDSGNGSTKGIESASLPSLQKNCLRALENLGLTQRQGGWMLCSRESL